MAISPWLIAASGFLIAWLALGWYTVQHPELQKHLTRFVPMSLEEQVQFRFQMALFALPIHPAILEIVAVILVWSAFLRTEWSDPMLFSAAVILSSTAILGGTEYAFYLAFRHWYGSTMVCAGVITYTVCLLLAHRAHNATLAVVSILAVAYAVVLPYLAMYDSVLDIIGGVFFGGAVLCASFFIAERAGVKPFAAAD